jgi:hypothetical protein
LLMRRPAKHVNVLRVSGLEFAFQKGIDGCFPALRADSEVIPFIG